jgi:predicted Zn-dependent protease
MTKLRLTVAMCAIVLALSACAETDGGAPTPTPQPRQRTEATRTVPVDAAQAKRLQAIMGPLIQNMDRPIPAGQVKMTVLADDELNAANGGGGDFYITTGLLQRGTDDQIRAVMAHEIAHADLNHVAKLGVVSTGVDIGFTLLDQIFPGSRVLAPVAGQLITNSYSRGEETAADAHGVEILNRAGYDGKALMADMLVWLQQTAGNGGGGFFATHPATGDRIAAVRNLP